MKKLLILSLSALTLCLLTTFASAQTPPVSQQASGLQGLREQTDRSLDLRQKLGVIVKQMMKM